MRILLVEDDKPLADALTALLHSSNHAVDWADNGLSADALVCSETFDLVILDLNLPELDGLALLKRIRARPGSPAVMILTARSLAEDRVTGLDLGADDYVSKPFDVREFEARVRSLLRRQAGLRSSVIRLGKLTLDLTLHSFTIEGQDLALPKRERGLLELFFLKAGKVVTKEAIIQSLTTVDDILSDNAIEQYVSRLRRRILPFGLNLRTARGIGYLLEKPVEP